MTSSNGNIFRVTGHLCGEFTGLRWIPRTKASDAELRWVCLSASVTAVHCEKFQKDPSIMKEATKQTRFCEISL